jgi:mono/diheme cytochrome c family protein
VTRKAEHVDNSTGLNAARGVLVLGRGPHPACVPVLPSDAQALAGKQIDLDVVRNGRRGMPAFGKRLDERQLEAVAAYVAEAL